MSSALIGWACLVLWSAWAFALQGALARTELLSPWTPEVGVVLLVGLASRMSADRARLGAVILALTRVGLGGDPPFAVLAVYLLVVEVVATIRRSVDTEGALLRALLAGLGGLTVVGWLAFVHAVRVDTPRPWTEPIGVWAWRAAFTTAALALVLGGWLRRLPGLGPLWKRELPWGVAEPVR